MRHPGPYFFGDKRKYARHALKGQAVFHGDEGDIVVLGELLDISHTGAGLRLSATQADMMWHLGSVGILHLDSPQLHKPISCYVRVARRVRKHQDSILIGLEILSIDDDSLEAVQRYRASHSHTYSA